MTAELRLSRDADGTQVALAVGDVVLLALPENPTTGYRWTVDADGLDVVDEQYSVGERSAVGGAGVRTFRLIARRRGDGVVRGLLKRAWEPVNAALDRCTIRFTTAG